MEPVPSARLEQGYAAQVLVYDDETYMMQDVAEEQEVETENVETGRHLIKCSLFLTFSFCKCQHNYCQLNNIPKNLFLMLFSIAWKQVNHFLREFIYIYEVLHNNSLRYNNLISLTLKKNYRSIIKLFLSFFS